MPDENRFDGIGEALGETDEADEDDVEADARTADDAVDAGDDATATTTDSEAAETATTERTETDLTETPAFPWSADQQRALYCRQETWEDFEDVVDFEVKRVLSDYGVRDPPKRELHDAMLRVVINHPEEVARTLLEERGIDVDASRE